MCGIAGIYRFDGEPVDPAQLRAMAQTLEHRGPDGHGVWSSGRIGFGHTRLSIIDVAGSPQPMASVDEQVHVCFNGEIFNYRELRAELDYPFRTHGDTEVLLASFLRHGVASVRDLVGQFAYAIHDGRTGELYLFRDRLGVLPLYYAVDGKRLVFASEAKALFGVLDGGAQLDHSQLGSYLSGKSVPAPATLFSGVRKLPPGHYLLTRPDGRISIERYWHLPEGADVLDVEPDAAVDLVETQLQEAVRAAMVADVPIGAYLSGGVDSSLIVALTSQAVPPGSLNTFSASFGDERYDETGYAQLVARQFATNHHQVEVRADDFADLWPALTRYRDAPLSEPADIAVFRLAEAARRHVKVVLSGEGSDELFGGYPKYRMARLTVAGRGGRTRTALMRAAERALPARAGRARIAARALSGRDPGERMVGWFAPFTRYEVEELTGVPLRSGRHAPEYRDGIDLMARMDLAAWLPDNLLERGDRMSMAASLELRPPFLDHRLVETALRLPSAVKVRDGQTKWVLKQVALRHLPAEIVQRPKLGFRVPLDAWFRSGLRDMCTDLLLGPDSRVADFLDPAPIRALLTSHDAGRRNEEIRLWTLLSLEVWARECLGQAAVV
jgi:asparagine synthase (glutamine-hydrolysing)